MKALWATLLAALLLCNLSACGNKGKLKTPTQMEKDEAKKAKKAEQEQQDKEDNANPDSIPGAILLHPELAVPPVETK